GYIFGGIMAARYGWRPAFLWAGVPGLLLAFTLFLFREPQRGASDVAGTDTPAPPVSAGRFRFYGDLLFYRAYVLVILGYVAQTFAMGGFAFWAPTFLHRIHGMDVEGAGTFFGAALVVTGLSAT